MQDLENKYLPPTFKDLADDVHHNINHLRTSLRDAVANVDNKINALDNRVKNTKTMLEDGFQKLSVVAGLSWAGVTALGFAGALSLVYSTVAGFIRRSNRKRESKKMKERMDELETATAFIATRLHARDWKPFNSIS